MRSIPRFLPLLPSLACLFASATRALSADAALPAFPGAEGFNTHLCTHGRGGRVMVVTSLADAKKGAPAAGTFRWACESTEEPRIVVFAVGGVLDLQKEVNVRPNIYIAGQTAPGDGLCLARAGLKLAGNTLIRHVRFRLGDRWPGGAALTKRDAFESRGDNVIIDHCSIAWTTDECFRIGGGENVTISHCFLGEGLHITLRAEMHNYGPALEPNFETGGATKNLAIHHCLFNGFSARSPLIGNGEREVHLLFANNVIYNYGGGKYPAMHTYAPKTAGRKAGAAFGRMDAVANYFKEGPVTPPGSPIVQVHGAYPQGGIHLAGNVSAAHPQAGGDEWAKLMTDAADPAVLARQAKAPQHANPGVALTDAASAFEQVVKNAGATFPKRDAVDVRFAADVRSGAAFRGTSGTRPRTADADAHGGRGEFRAYYDYIYEDPAKLLARHAQPHASLALTLADLDPVPGGQEYFATFQGAAAPRDTDADGIPDAWEKARALDPNDAKDNTKPMPGGYTAIEEYLEALLRPNP